MKQTLILTLFFVVSITVFSFGLSAEDFKSLKDYQKAIQAAEWNDDWAKAAHLCEEIVNMPIDSKSKDAQSKFNYISDAYWRLGHYYLHAHHYKFDIYKAIYNFERSSEYRGYHDHSGMYGKAELYLTMIYNIQKYGVQNLQKSLNWLKKGAEKCAIAEYMLGEVYENGYTFFLKDYIYVDERTGNKMNSVNTKQECEPKLEFPNVQQNLKLAYECYYSYYERNSCYIEGANEEVCRYKVAVALMEGQLLPQNYNDAFEYFQMFLNRTEEGSLEKYKDYHADTYWRLSVMYRYGYGTIENELKAEEYLSKAAQLGHPQAIAALRK